MSSSHVPLEIELEIMKRLPPKSLIRFMSACKAWKSLISCSEFVSRHRVLPTNRLLVEFREEKSFERNYVSFVDDDTFPTKKLALTSPLLLQLLDKPRIIGTSCGLFCFHGLLRKPEDHNNQTGMCVLWNPTIRKSVAVAMPNQNQPSEYNVGFGVCPSTKVPKLVKISYTYPRSQVMVFTLSSEGGEWRRLSSNHGLLPRGSIRFESDETTVIGQFIYWLGFDMKKLRRVIMPFDLSTDEFTQVDLPDGFGESSFIISTLRESLVLLVYNFKDCDVWMMMGNGDRKAFTKLYTIKNVLWKAVAFRKSGQPIIKRINDLPGALVAYEPTSGYTKYFWIGGTGLVRVHSYMESLLLLDHDDGHIVSLRCGDVKT